MSGLFLTARCTAMARKGCACLLSFYRSTSNVFSPRANIGEECVWPKNTKSIKRSQS